MKRPACNRAWEAEAAENGRLDRGTRASFERHAAMCDVCYREREAWKRLTAIVVGMPLRTASELDRRRGRVALLREAHRRTVEDPRWIGDAWRLVLAAAVVVVAIGWFYRRSHFENASSTAIERRFVEVQPTGPADWNLDDPVAPTRMTLRDGTVSLHVSKVRDGRRFVVVVPDGEIEVRGTRFVVAVGDSRTRRVEVSEGTVSLRLATQAEMMLRAGETWNVKDSLDPVASAATTPPPSAAPPTMPSPLADRRAVRPKPPETTLPSAGSSFASAMSAYTAGDLDRAEELLTAFTRRFPDDARCEDAELIGILIGVKSGNRTGARRRAHRYLAKYPGGLHEAEVERFLREP